MHSFNVSYRVLTAVFATLLIIFSVVQLGLDGYTLSYTSKYLGYHGNFTYTSTANFVRTFHFLPYVRLVRSYDIQLAAGAVGVVFGAVILGFSFRSKPMTFIGTGNRPARNVTWPYVSGILSVILLAIALTTLVISFYDYTHYGPPSIQMGLCLAIQLDASNISTCSSAQLFNPMTVEGWTCRLSDVYLAGSALLLSATDDAADIIPRACTVSRLARWWTIPLFILPLILILLPALEFRRQNIVRFKSQEQAQYVKEPSFSSSIATTTVPTMTASAAAAAATTSHSPLSPVSELHDDERLEKHGHQLSEAPEKSAYNEVPAEKWQVYSELAAIRSEERLEKKEREEKLTKIDE